MNMTAILIVLIVFGTITAIVFGPSYLKSREKREIQETVRHAIDKGQQLPPELIDALTRDVASKLPSRSRDLRLGVILFAVSLGIALMGYGISFEEMDALYPFAGFAAIPGMIGLAFIVLSFFNKNKS